jgi:hypothetical protein
MAQEKWSGPYHWAAFTLIGDMGEVELMAPSDRTWLWVGGGLLLLAIFAGAGLWLRLRNK